MTLVHWITAATAGEVVFFLTNPSPSCTLSLRTQAGSPRLLTLSCNTRISGNTHIAYAHTTDYSPVW